MKYSNTITRLAIASSLIATNAFANDAIDPGDSDSRWVAGGAAVAFTNVYAGEDNESTLFPSFQYNGERFFVKNGSINLAIGSQGEFSYGLTASPSGTLLSDDSEYDDNAKLAGLVEREYTMEGGFYVFHTTDKGRMKFILNTDLGSKHDGQTAVLSYTFDLRAGDWYVNPYVGAEWISSGKADHFYGVSEAEATESRDAYKADSTLNLFAGVRGRYELTDHWDVNLNAGFVAIGDGIKDSSIVEEDYAYHTSVGINYNF